MSHDISNKLIVAISSRALFNLEESNAVFENQGIDAYWEYQIANENNTLDSGVAFPLVKKLLALKSIDKSEAMVEVILLSRNSADTGLRVFNSIQEHQLNITRAAFTSGNSPYQYITAFGAHLFLSANPIDVKNALQAGCAAATILPGQINHNHNTELRIAFDGDSVLFSDEAERIYKTQGLKAFTDSELASADTPLSGGPFKGFLSALHQLQQTYPPESCPLRTALVTARSAPAHERVIRTLRAWNIRIDEALFLGGLEKAKFLQAFGADIFFDDQHLHCHSTRQFIATGHVPHGVANE